MLVLLNPLLVILYLTDVVAKLERGQFARVLSGGALIAAGAFCGFAIMGDAVFSDVLQAEFASFQIFGGIVFLLIALQFVFRGPTAIEMLRGDSKNLAGAIAMPVLVGPGTISASVVIGERHEPATACGAILIAVFVSVGVMLGLKAVHDYVRPRTNRLVDRYVEIVGRVAALYIGTVSVDLIMQGVRAWIAKFPDLS